MKTTVELPDALVQEAKEAAIENGTTLRALIEMGLRIAMDDLRRHEKVKPMDETANIHASGTQPPESS